MIKKNLLIIYLLVLIVVTAGCKEGTTPESVHNKVEGVEEIDDKETTEIIPVTSEEITQDIPLKIKITDNRRIFEDNKYHDTLNEDGTFMFREKYELNDKYYMTYYRTDKEGNILNVYDDSIDGIKDHKFNDDGFAIVVVHSESQEPGKSGELVKMNTIMDMNGNYIIDPVHSIESSPSNPWDSDKTYFYKIINSKYDDYGLIGYEGKILNRKFETVLEMPLYTKDNSPSNIWNEVYITNEFIFYNDKIITAEGDIINTNLVLEGDEHIRKGDDIVWFEKDNQVSVINKDGLYKKIEILPNMIFHDSISKDLYSYYDVNREKYIYIYDNEEIYSANIVMTPLIRVNDKYIFSHEIEENRYKLITIESGTLKESDKEFYKILGLENHYATREIRENGKPGFWTIYDQFGNEVVLNEGSIVEMYDTRFYFLARINNNDVLRYINYPILRNRNKLEIYDEEELRQIFLRNLSNIRYN